MSWDKIHAATRRRRDLSMTEKVIFSWLVPLVSKGIHPGYRTIALECGIDKNTARKALGDLERHGLLRIEGAGAGRRCRYHVTWDPENWVRDSPSPSAEPGESLTQSTDGDSHPVVEPDRVRLSPSQPGETFTHHWVRLSPGTDGESHPQPDHQTNSDQEPDVDARARASAPTRTREASPTTTALTPAGVFKLVDGRWLRERGETIPGGWFGQRHTDACSVIELAARTVDARAPAPADRDSAVLELIEAELAAFITAKQRDSMSNPWLVFVRGFGGWAHTKRRSGPAKPGSIEDFDREAERLEREGYGAAPPRPARLTEDEREAVAL